MKTLKHWQLHSTENNCIELLVDQRHTFCLYILEPDLFRVLIKRQHQLALDRTWSIAVDGELQWQGRPRLSCAGFSLPPYQVTQNGATLQISTEQLRVTIQQPLSLNWQYRDGMGQWQHLVEDRPTGAYLLGAHHDGVAHYQRRYGDEQFYGLGEKTGDLNRAGRRFEMRNLDAMGYNAASTDPLYKHIPFTITRRNQVSFGLFYDNLSSCWFDLGNELDNYHLPYRRYQAEAGDMDYYLFLGPKVLDVSKKFVRLTGKTLFGPKWSLGYSGSTMSYTDAADAQQRLLQFITLCQQHTIPCDSFQLSSGYTSIGDKRYVFNWNYDKIPDPKALTQAFHQAGLKLAANIKPCLLQDHPQYRQVAQAGLFIQDSQSAEPERSVFWDDEGSHLDFTHPATIDWWQENVTQQLLEVGIDATWNDNNEYEVWDGEARCHGFGQPIAIKHIRPLMPLLMMRASFEAQQRFAPTLRPYLISRSGCAGMQRYVQTWSGDNRTSWQTLRYNIRMGLGMSLSGLYNIGHDVGGFAGEKPDAQLFVRWVQNGIMHPRFTIHSWNDDKTANEPWMHSTVTPIIRETIHLRYRLLPYFYHLLWQAHENDEPMLRPTFLDHEHDANTFSENDDFMLGRDLLVASVVQPDQYERDVYLPDNSTGWYCFYTGQWFDGGQTITVAAPLERLPLLVRAGSVLPMTNLVAAVGKQRDNQRQLGVFPPQGIAQTSGQIFDDDGESYGYLNGAGLWLNWQLKVDEQQIHLSLTGEGSYRPAWQQLQVVLPQGETRELLINGSATNEVALAACLGGSMRFFQQDVG